MGLLPSRVFANPDPEAPRVLDIEGADADRAFEALSSETARRILAVIYEQPRTPTEVREEVGTSLQNVHYHLDKLESAELIEPAGTGYSEKGNEMTVYAPRNEALVLFAGHDHDRSRLESLLGRVLSLFVVLVTATAAVALLTREQAREAGGQAVSLATESSADGAGGASAAPTQPGLVESLVAEPAFLFFLGGVLMLAAITAYWYVRE
ncbi:ArsR/SmtB family transcription factor [Halorarius litoreus]|uniref:ArsR/SmtB family transcription factor n=1 Tax=Halorarius litoreus TaxID=2962676 RepID=UPI0020CBA210|nr:helix-turn-helix domain-containing protein [Halorarius litoreus]